MAVLGSRWTTNSSPRDNVNFFSFWQSQTANTMCIFLKDATLEFPWAVHHYLVLINKCEAGHIYEKVFSRVNQSRKQVRHTEIIWRKNFSAVLFEKAGGSHLSEHRIGLFLWSSTGLRCPTLSFNALLHSPSMPFNVLHSPSLSFTVPQSVEVEKVSAASLETAIGPALHPIFGNSTSKKRSHQKNLPPPRQRNTVSLNFQGL